MSSGVYVPRQLRRAQQTAPQSDEELQKTKWEQLKHAINSILNKVTEANIRAICTEELFRPNLLRGRGYLCQTLMISQRNDPAKSPLFAALVSVIHSKLPMVGELLVHRLIVQYQQFMRRNQEKEILSTLQFICHLTNQSVVSYILIFEILQQLLLTLEDAIPLIIASSAEEDLGHTSPASAQMDIKQPQGGQSQDVQQQMSVAARNLMLATNIVLHCGELLKNEAPEALQKLVDTLRGYLQEILFLSTKDQFSTQVKFILEDFFGHYGNDFAEHPQYPEDLLLIEPEDQNTLTIRLSDEHNTEKRLDRFIFEPDWMENQEKWDQFYNVLIGKADQSLHPVPDGGDADDDEASPYQQITNVDQAALALAQGSSSTDAPHMEGFGEGGIHDAHVDPETAEIQRKREIYLILSSDVSADAVTHQLLKKIMKDCRTIESFRAMVKSVAVTIRDTALTLKGYQKGYGTIAILLCESSQFFSQGQHRMSIGRTFRDEYDDLFRQTWMQLNLMQLGQLTQIRTSASFFAHLLSAFAISFSVFEEVKLQLGDSDADSSTRVFLKDLLQGLKELMGTDTLLQIILDPRHEDYMSGLFPTTNAEVIEVAIRYYEAIGILGLTTPLRQALEKHNALILTQQGGEFDSDSESTSTDLSELSDFSDDSDSWSR